MSGNWLDLSATSNLYSRMYMNGFLDVSGGNVLIRPGLTNNNHLIIQGGDISLNGRLFSTRDISLNGNLNIGGNLSVSQFSSNKTITTTNYQLVVAEDLSLNGRLFVSNNVGIGTTNPGFILDVSAGTGTKIHSLYINAQSNDGTMALGCYNQQATGNFGTGFALYQGTNGATVINAQSGQTIGLKINNNSIATINSTGVGIGANPQSALDVSGAIRVSGGITPTYSSPSFSAGQVGYVYSVNCISSPVAYAAATATNLTINTSTLPPGLYTGNFYSQITPISGCQRISLNYTVGLTNVTLYGTPIISYNSYGITDVWYGVSPVTFNVTSATSQMGVQGYAPAVGFSLTQLYLIATRVA